MCVLGVVRKQGWRKDPPAHLRSVEHVLPHLVSSLLWEGDLGQNPSCGLAPALEIKSPSVCFCDEKNMFFFLMDNNF